MQGDPIRVTTCPTAQRPTSPASRGRCSRPPTPEGFLGLLHAQAEGPVATEQFLAEHPDIAEATARIAAAGDPPRSWATMAFNSLNAYRLAPDAGEESLPLAERATADNDYLMTGIVEQLPVRFRLLAQLAHDDDQTTDASAAWPILHIRTHLYGESVRRRSGVERPASS